MYLVGLVGDRREGRAEETLTLCPVSHLVVCLLVWPGTLGLHADIPDSCPEDGYGDQAVSCCAPEVLDEEVLSPLVCYPNLRGKPVSECIGGMCLTLITLYIELTCLIKRMYARSRMLRSRRPPP